MNGEIKAIIVEDVESYLLTIEKLVLEVAPNVNVVGKSSSLNGAKEMILTLNPDVVLLDIQFEMEGKTAFDMLHELAEIGKLRFQIIFITAHQEAKYYSEAFAFNALHFVEKPIDSEKLRDALKRVSVNHNTDDIPWLTQFGELHKKMHSTRNEIRIVVEGHMFSELIVIGEIAMIEASGRYSTLLLRSGRKIVSCKNLGEYEKMLDASEMFVRIHKNRIINLNLVRRYSKKERLIELEEPLGKYFASKDRFRDFLDFTDRKIL